MSIYVSVMHSKSFFFSYKRMLVQWGHFVICGASKLHTHASRVSKILVSFMTCYHGSQLLGFAEPNTTASLLIFPFYEYPINILIFHITSYLPLCYL